jgi:hypothetical protein
MKVSAAALEASSLVRPFCRRGLLLMQISIGCDN